MFTYKYKLLTGCLSVMILVIAGQLGLFDFIPTAHAITLSQGTGVKIDGSLGDALVDLTAKIALVNTFMHVVLLIVLEFLGYLLQADFFNNPQMMNGLYNIWVLSRDIMNVLFAVMLIGVSFFVIITGKTDKAKEHVVNFVVAVILVNFSWFFPRVIIDVANVVTAAIYTVPNTMSNTIPCQTIETNGAQPCKVITEILIFPTPTESANFCGGGGPNCSCFSQIECHKTEDFATAAATMAPAHAMINGLAVSFARISVLAKIPQAQGTFAQGLSAGDAVLVTFKIAISIILAFAIQLAVLLPLIGLAVGLFIRILILWVTTAFMPFSFIGYVINGKLGTAVFGFETDIWQEFINAAFLPAMVAVPFTVGFIMLSAVSTVPAPATIQLNMSTPIIAGVTTWWALMWTGAAIAIIWIGSFKALAKSQITGKITERLRGFGENVFSGMAHAPLLLPIPLPGGNKAGVNLGTLVHGPKIVSDSIRLAAGGRSGKKFGDTIKDAFGVGTGGGTSGQPTGENPEDVAEKFRRDADNTKKIVDAVRDITTGAGNRQEHFKTINESLKTMGVDGRGSESHMKNLLLEVANSTKGKSSDELKELVALRQNMERIVPNN